MRGYLAIILLIVMIKSSFYQSGYNLQITVDGWRDTTVYLGYHHGESTFVKDTSKASSKGEFAFTGSDPLPEGVFLVALS